MSTLEIPQTRLNRQGRAMATRYLWIIAVVFGVTTSLSADPMRYPYWQMIKDVVSNVESQPPTPITISDNNIKTNVEYPFELIRHLRATDLLNAAVEGAQEARLQAALGKPSEELDALVLNNVALALEYLPMLIRNKEDLAEIALLMEKRDQDKILRMYLLENSFPGFAPPSFLSMSLPEFIRENDEAFSRTTLEIAKHPMEDPLLQSTALDIYNLRLIEKYRRCLENDPLIAEMKADDENINVIAKAKENASLLSEETQKTIKIYRRQFHDFAFDIAGHIAEGSVRDERVKEKTKQILAYMRDNIIGTSEEILNAFIAGKPYNSSPFPKFPGESALSTETTGIAPTDRIDVIMEKLISDESAKDNL